MTLRKHLTQTVYITVEKAEKGRAQGQQASGTVNGNQRGLLLSALPSTPHRQLQIEKKKKKTKKKP